MLVNLGQVAGTLSPLLGSLWVQSENSATELKQIYFSVRLRFDFCDAPVCVCGDIPSFGKVGPVVNHVAREVAMAGPVPQWCGERLSEHVLQVISVVGSHPAGVGHDEAAHTVGLR